ncbi:MAG: GNAT family N-acetyltransferase, partial [Elusimicrobia bacterium]|nr:GNAT family N-acetyltransferase [Elusimicrobiota bacterium]
GKSTMRVALRDIAAADVPTLYSYQSDPVANRLAGFVPRKRAPFVAHWKKILKDAAVEKKLILLDGVAAGYLVCFIRVRPDREVGYWISRDHWGKGLATKALRLFLKEYAFRPLYARVAKHNAASLKVVRRNGFKIIGEDKFSNAAGEKYDEYVLRLAPLD